GIGSSPTLPTSRISEIMRSGSGALAGTNKPRDTELKRSRQHRQRLSHFPMRVPRSTEMDDMSSGIVFQSVHHKASTMIPVDPNLQATHSRPFDMIWVPNALVLPLQR